MKFLLLPIFCCLTALTFSGTASADAMPVTDTHLHYSHDAWDVYPPAEAVALLRKAGLKRAFVSSSSDDGTQMLVKEAPDLVIPVLRPYSRRGQISTWMNDPASLELLTGRLAKNRYAGIGEFHAFGEDINTDVLQGVLALAKKYDIFLHAHSDAEAVDLIFKNYPEAHVLWAHSGFETVSTIRDMLKRHPKLWADLAFRSEHIDGETVDPEWQDLFEAFPDRFMVGTDTFAPERWSYVIPHAQRTRTWLDSLSDELAEKIAWRNSEALLAKYLKQ